MSPQNKGAKVKYKTKIKLASEAKCLIMGYSLIMLVSEKGRGGSAGVKQNLTLTNKGGGECQLNVNC